MLFSIGKKSINSNFNFEFFTLKTDNIRFCMSAFHIDKGIEDNV